MTRKEKRKPLKGLLMVRVRNASVYYVNPPSGALHSFTRSQSRRCTRIVPLSPGRHDLHRDTGDGRDGRTVGMYRGSTGLFKQ